jgi:hypothetical protein
MALMDAMKQPDAKFKELEEARKNKAKASTEAPMELDQGPNVAAEAAAPKILETASSEVSIHSSDSLEIG